MIAFVGLIGVCSCSVLLPAPSGRILTPAVAAVNTEYDPAPQYAYAYNIQDALTGDQKSQQETRDGDVVKGIDVDDQSFWCFVFLDFNSFKTA